jgi:hypothetical protein
MINVRNVTRVISGAIKTPNPKSASVITRNSEFINKDDKRPVNHIVGVCETALNVAFLKALFDGCNSANYS